MVQQQVQEQQQPAEVAEGAVVDAAARLVVPQPADAAEVLRHAGSALAAVACMPESFDA